LKPVTSMLSEKGFRGQLREDEPLNRHCSLKVGGPAEILAIPEDVEDLGVVTATLEKEGLPWIVLGGGTNILFANGVYPGCVILMGKGFSSIRLEKEKVLFAGASVPLLSLVARTGEEGLSGLECLSGIPGTVGGAVRMNAGTGSGEISHTLEETQIFADGTIRWVKRSELDFAYRCSGIREGEVVLGARFRLASSSSGAVREKIRKQALARRKSQPLGVPSAGCWFRNPEGDSAGRLIDKAGMKGATWGGARVSGVHANFLVNSGEATARDFLDLAEKVRQSVFEKFGIRLEEEVRVIHG